MDLGEGIRKALAKITGATLVDESAVKELVRELQRTLITNDVSVKLVAELCKRIEKRCLEEKQAPGLDLREHVVKVVYEELVALLGGEKYEPQVKKQRILLLGLFGSGKCVHPDTRIPLANGNVLPISKLFEEQSGRIEECDDGKINHLDTPLKVFSFDPLTLKMQQGTATRVWKLAKTEPLIKVGLDMGNASKISTTPEHPFFVLDKGEIKQLRADGLSVGQFVAVPRKLPFNEESNWANQVRNFSCRPDVLVHSRDCADKLKAFLLNRFGTLWNAFEELKLDFAYCTFTSNLKAGHVYGGVLSKCLNLGFEHEIRPEFVQIRSADYKARIPLETSADLAEFLGYVWGDGHLEKGYVDVTNEDTEILSRIAELSQKLFGLQTKIRKEKRSPKLFRAIIASKTLVAILNTLYELPFGKKSNKIGMPAFLLTAPKNVSAAFLQAYFDCDGFIAKNTRSIEMVSASESFARGLHYLLRKHEISSTISMKTVKGRNYWRVCVIATGAEKFAFEIGSIVPFKQARLVECAPIGNGQSFGKREMLSVGNTIKQVREHYGASIGEVQKYVSSYGIYEQEGLISRNSLRLFLKAIEKTKNKNNEILKFCSNGANYKDVENACGEPKGWLNASLYRLSEQGLLSWNGNQVNTTAGGIQFLKQAHSFNAEAAINSLQLLSQSEIEWAPIKSIELDENTEFVYDLTVDFYHNFVANEVIVHNTTTSGKIAKFYHSRGLKVALIAGDVHRPAAFEQLQQVAQSVGAGFYGEKGEKDAGKIARNALEKLKDYDVLVFDSAGRSAFDEELANELKDVNAAFAPDEKFLVVSADIGQVAGRQATEFNNAVGVTGVIVTKLDGSGKGGGALSAVSASKSRVAFIALGEKPDAFEVFDAKRFVSRLCGFPDLNALLEKVSDLNKEEALQKAIEEGRLDFDTFLTQMKAMKKMGPLKQIMQMMGAYDLPEELVGKSEEKMKSFESAVLSMTPYERKNPELMKNKARQERVARGSGLKPDDVRELVSNFERVHKMMKGMRGNRGMMKHLQKMMPNFKGMGM